MIKNLQDYFEPEQEIFLDEVNYKRIDSSNKEPKQEFALLCQDNVRVSISEEGVRVVITRSMVFDPRQIFSLNVSFGIDLKFNEKKMEYDWKNINLAEEFMENGDFVTTQLVSRISLLIAQITSSFGQPPIISPPTLAEQKKS